MRLSKTMGRTGLTSGKSCEDREEGQKKNSKIEAHAKSPIQKSRSRKSRAWQEVSVEQTKDNLLTTSLPLQQVRHHRPRLHPARVQVRAQVHQGQALLQRLQRQSSRSSSLILDQHTNSRSTDRNHQQQIHRRPLPHHVLPSRPPACPHRRRRPAIALHRGLLALLR